MIVVLACVFSCKKAELSLYDIPKDGIQFAYPDGEFQQDFDFSFQYIDVDDEWGYPMPSYLGDSLQTKRISLIVSLLGWESKEDRSFKLKATEGVGLSPELIQLENEYIFAANQLKDTIDVVLLRPSSRGEFNIELQFDTEGTGFDLGVEENGKYTITITDRYPKPSDWDARINWLGEYSEEKYAFIVTTLNITYGYYVDWGSNNLRLRNALEKYNQENPDNRKDFTFPVNTNSIWD